MGKRLTKILVAAIFTIAMACGVVTAASAAVKEPDAEPMTKLIALISPGLSKSSSKITLNCNAVGSSKVTKVTIKGTLQRKSNVGTGWSDVNTVTQSKNGNALLYTRDTSPAKEGYTYRAKYKVTMTDGTTNETMTVTSNTIVF